MEAQLEKLKEVQKAAWNKSSAGWKKWDQLMMRFLQPLNDEMISMLNFKSSDFILDVATGTGEPGLTIASKLTTGKVTGIDLSENMLAVARENAALRKIENYDTVCGDVTEMPFEDETFDCITCRLGFMLFPDMNLALNEMIRVLKRGGRICASVWNGSEKNSWVSNSMDVMINRLELNRPTPGAPGIFRCADSGTMTSLFSNAGLINIEETNVEGKLFCENKEGYWNFISEVASPVAFINASDNIKQQIKTEVLSGLNEESPDGTICLSSSTFVICGEKQ